MDILGMFYQEFLYEASSGNVNCSISEFTKDERDDDGIHALEKIYFDSIVEGNRISVPFYGEGNDYIKPTLIINNKELFNSLLLEYLDLARDFYKGEYYLLDKSVLLNINKLLLARMFLNFTFEDFNDPCSYLRRRISFFKNKLDTSHEEVEDTPFLDGKLIIDITNDVMVMETPYLLNMKLVDKEGYEYYFPSLTFGIDGDTVYLYTLQLRDYEDFINSNKYSKKVNRLFYKVNEGLDLNEDVPYLKDVTASFVVAASLALSFFYKQGFNKFMVNSILITRWNEKMIRANNPEHRELLTEEAAKKYKEKVHKIQYNLSEKFLYTFLRLIHQSNGVEIIGYPLDYNSYLTFTMDDNVSFNNKLLDDSFNCVVDSKKYIK